MLRTIHRFQLAVRLRAAARRSLGLAVDLPRLLGDHRYARQVLALCHDSIDFGLGALARSFEATGAAEDAQAHLAAAARTAREQLAQLAHRGLQTGRS